jgi:hypothetical protein
MPVGRGRSFWRKMPTKIPASIFDAQKLKIDFSSFKYLLVKERRSGDLLWFVDTEWFYIVKNVGFTS